jgi:hypothetical protein
MSMDQPTATWLRAFGQINLRREINFYDFAIEIAHLVNLPFALIVIPSRW